jgi:hypothetical protein
MKILFFLLFGISSIFAESLPNPNLKDNFLNILMNRQSSRNFNPSKEIDNKVLSDILFVSVGVNRKDGKLVIPTAKDTRDIDVYVIKKNGAFLYVKEKHELKKITSNNLFNSFSANQLYVNDSSIILVYTSKSAENSSFMHVGSAYQNVAIYCAENNIKNVVRAFFDKENVKKELKLDKEVSIIVSQSIGY